MPQNRPSRNAGLGVTSPFHLLAKGALGRTAPTSELSRLCVRLPQKPEAVKPRAAAPVYCGVLAGGVGACGQVGWAARGRPHVGGLRAQHLSPSVGFVCSTHEIKGFFPGAEKCSVFHLPSFPPALLRDDQHTALCFTRTVYGFDVRVYCGMIATERQVSIATSCSYNL